MGMEKSSFPDIVYKQKLIDKLNIKEYILDFDEFIKKESKIDEKSIFDDDDLFSSSSLENYGRAFFEEENIKVKDPLLRKKYGLTALQRQNDLLNNISSCKMKVKQYLYIENNLIGAIADIVEVNCPICLCIGEDLNSPIMSNCGHIFCRLCLTSSFINFEKFCPVCREKITFIYYYSILQHLISKAILMKYMLKIYPIFPAISRYLPFN